MSTTTSGSVSSKGFPPHRGHGDRRLRWLGCNIQAGISYHHYGHMDVILPAPI
jgi:hypothetical protein